VQLAYLEFLPVLLVTATFGMRTGVAVAIAVSVPAMILEYNGTFRLRNSSLPANIFIMAAVLVCMAVLFDYFLRVAAERNDVRDREMFVALAENSSDFVGMTDRAGNMVYGNRAALDLLAIEDARTIHFLDCFTPEDRTFVKAVIMPAIERDGRWVGEFKMRNSVPARRFRSGTIRSL
jgi:PAS domain-containing protein